MSDITHGAARVAAAQVSSAGSVPRLRLLAPYVCVALGGTAGLAAGHAMGGDSMAVEDKLLLLLRFMAAMKLVGVMVGAGLLHWRLTHEIASPLATGYVAALVVMAAASGLIWSLGAIALGALLFHAGLLAFLVLAWRDDGLRLPRRR